MRLEQKHRILHCRIRTGRRIPFRIIRGGRIENFEKLRTENFYYVDKTDLIKELLDHWAEVNLFTRPRRFGKSLNMSMLRNFFEFGGNRALFQNLKISEETTLCEEFMGKFPVLSLSLKGMNAETYEKACGMARQVIRSEARRFQYLLESERLTPYDKEVLTSWMQSDPAD